MSTTFQAFAKGWGITNRCRGGTNTADNTVSVFLGKKDGTFQPPTAFSTGAATAPPRLPRQILTAMASLTLP